MKKFKLEQPVYWHAGKTLYKGRIKKIVNVEMADGFDLYYYVNYLAYTDSKNKYKQMPEKEGCPYEYGFHEDELFLSEDACKYELKKKLEQLDLQRFKNELKIEEANLKYLEKYWSILPDEIKEKKAVVSRLKKKIKKLEDS